jgi:hypothetical protein
MADLRDLTDDPRVQAILRADLERIERMLTHEPLIDWAALATAGARDRYRDERQHPEWVDIGGEGG